jgi:hypothetical protein
MRSLPASDFPTDSFSCESSIQKTEEAEQIMVPQQMIKKVIYMGHNKFGHQGNNRSLVSLKKKFYWVCSLEKV